MLDFVKNAGVEAIEIGTGGYLDDAHCNVDALLARKKNVKSIWIKCSHSG